MRLASPILLAAAAAAATPSAWARTEVLKTRDGSVVHWTRAELTVGIDAAAGSRSVAPLDVAHAIQLAARAWNRIPASQPHLRYTAEPGRDVTVSFCRGRWQGEAIDLGRTQFSASLRDGTVTSAVIELNECDHHFTPPGEKASDPFDLQSVVTHELGHVLGLGHSDLATAIMFPSGNGVAVRMPSADDETALALIYLGREPLAATAPPPAQSLQPAQWRRGTVGAPGTPSAGQPGPAAAAQPASQADRPRVPTAPADSVSALDVKTNGKHAMIVYTGEPTLLPPWAESQPAKAKKPPAATSPRGRSRP